MLSIKDLTELLDRLPQWKRMKDSPARIDKLEERLKAIEDKMSGTGELCPFCKQPALELLEIQPLPFFEESGIKKYIYKCLKCGKPYKNRSKISKPRPIRRHKASA